MSNKLLDYKCFLESFNSINILEKSEVDFLFYSILFMFESLDDVFIPGFKKITIMLENN